MKTLIEAFERQFASFDLHLPDPLPARGELRERGWTIRYVVLADEHGQPCLEYVADHRMTNSRHVRILSSGEMQDLPSFESDFGFDPSVPGAREQAEANMRAHNAAVLADLKSKGLR